MLLLYKMWRIYRNTRSTTNHSIRHSFRRKHAQDAKEMPSFVRFEEQNLTEEDLVAIFAKYLAVVTDSELDVDYQKVEYYD